MYISGMVSVVVLASLCLVGLTGNCLTVTVLIGYKSRTPLVHLLLALAVTDAALLLSIVVRDCIPDVCAFLEAQTCLASVLWHDRVWLWQTACLIQTAGSWILVLITLDR